MARGAGLRISAAEGIDAARAVDLVGYADRARLKDTLGLVLAKTAEEKAVYAEAFELFFRRDELGARASAAPGAESLAPPPGGPAGRQDRAVNRRSGP